MTQTQKREFKDWLKIIGLWGMTITTFTQSGKIISIMSDYKKNIEKVPYLESRVNRIEITTIEDSLRINRLFRREVINN